MTAGDVCRYSPDDASQENMETNRGEAGSLHERLVAYVHTLDHGSRRGVWSEHSYARGDGGGSARGASCSRALFAPRPLPPPESRIDVDEPAPAPLSPPAAKPAPPPDSDSDDDPADAEDWEARVCALAPRPSHARLAEAACDALRRMRLARLTTGGGAHARGEAHAAARRLRRALALAGGAPDAPAWLQAALTACMPPSARRLYAEALGALRERAPRVVERLTGARAPAPTERALGLCAPVGPHSEPWLVWVSSGCATLDARWERRLAGLVHTRVLRAPAGVAGSPEAWCAGAAGSVRSQLTDALAEAGDRSIILGGCGAGAALCLLLARGAGGAARGAGGVRGAVLVGPPLRTPEGPLPLGACRLPLLLVVGTHAPSQPRATAHRVAEVSGAGADAEAGAGAGWGLRRVLEVHGADEQLRLPRRLRSRLALPQHALDAALAEECVRWAVETAEGEEVSTSPPPPLPPIVHPTRRHPLPTIVHQINLDGPEEDYAHLPQTTTAVASSVTQASLTTQSARSIEIVEGRVVSRAAGGTPLPLLPPPRRSATPSPRAPAPAPVSTPCESPSPADIMQMPIVFADDNATDSSSTGSPVTVTSGKARGNSVTPPVKLTRVILAKRGGRTLNVRAGAPGGAGTAGGRAPPAPGLLAVRGGGPRRLLVRRGMRLVSRQDKS